MVLMVMLPAGALAAGRVEFDDPAWAMRGENTRIESYRGRKALRMGTGAAYLPDVEFENGTIEFDFSTTGVRSFVGVRFRLDPDGNGEYIYFRPHNDGKWDAMQYTPIDHGMTSWQLYSGEGYSAAAPVPADRWIHVRVEVDGSRAEVFVDGAERPALTVTDLKRGKANGGVGLASFYPGDGSGNGAPTAFADFNVRPVEAEADYRPAVTPAAGSGIVGAWVVGPAFVPPDGEIRNIATEWVDPRWSRAVSSEESGLVNLARLSGMPDGSSQVGVVARFVIRSARPQEKRLNFGFSDRVVLFHDRRPIFSGDNTYRSRSPRYLGIMTIDHEAVFLQLRKGDNEIAFVVTEAFGGWGVIARLEDLDGIEIRQAE